MLSPFHDLCDIFQNSKREKKFENSRLQQISKDKLKRFQTKYLNKVLRWKYTKIYSKTFKNISKIGLQKN